MPCNGRDDDASPSNVDLGKIETCIYGRARYLIELVGMWITATAGARDRPVYGSHSKPTSGSRGGKPLN